MMALKICAAALSVSPVCGGGRRSAHVRRKMGKRHDNGLWTYLGFGDVVKELTAFTVLQQEM
jgi:hypothetical protein